MTKLLHLPVDIPLDMLIHLDAYKLVQKILYANHSLVNRDQICDALRRVIIPLSRGVAIDLKYFHMIPSPLFCPGFATGRKSLRQSQTGWQKAEYS